MCMICGGQSSVRYVLDNQKKICEHCFFRYPGIYHATCLTCQKKVRACVPGCPCYDDVLSTDEEEDLNQPEFCTDDDDDESE
jgi:hypothetical protein